MYGMELTFLSSLNRSSDPPGIMVFFKYSRGVGRAALIGEGIKKTKEL